MVGAVGGILLIFIFILTLWLAHKIDSKKPKY